MVDCFDRMLVSWAIGTSPAAELVKTMLDVAVATLAKRVFFRATCSLI